MEIELCKYSGCNLIGTFTNHKDRTNDKYCAKHFRFTRMIRAARGRNKYVPTFHELEVLLENLVNFQCPSCQKQMKFTVYESGMPDIVSLQHNRDGSISLICLSCNSRHQHYPNDSFYFRDKNMKRCSKCKTEKMLNQFHKSNNTVNILKLQTYCKDCIKIGRNLNKISNVA